MNAYCMGVVAKIASEDCEQMSITLSPYCCVGGVSDDNGSGGDEVTTPVLTATIPPGTSPDQSIEFSGLSGKGIISFLLGLVTVAVQAAKAACCGKKVNKKRKSKSGSEESHWCCALLHGGWLMCFSQEFSLPDTTMNLNGGLGVGTADSIYNTTRI